jgi:hypothetical protein
MPRRKGVPAWVSRLTLILGACAPSVLAGGCAPSVPQPPRPPPADTAAGGHTGTDDAGPRPDTRPGSGGARADATAEIITDAMPDTMTGTLRDTMPGTTPDAGIGTAPDGPAVGGGGDDGPAGGDGGAAGDAGGPGGDADGTDDGHDGPPPVAPRAGEVVVDEMLVNPAGTDTGREWIEILNTTALALDLEALHVADASKEVAVAAGVLAPGAVLLLGQSADPTKNGGAPVTLAYGTTISLNNDGDTITLCLGSCAGGLILDRVSWSGDLGPSYDGHAAMVTAGTGTFCPADQPFGTAGSFGTPGAPNPPCD